MKEKQRALLMLGLVSFLLPLGQIAILKRPGPTWSTLTFAELFLTTYAIYWWYVLDKRERNFRAGRFQDFGVIFLCVIALPVYFVRSRGWTRGGLATVGALGILVCIGLLSYLGEIAGGAIAF